MLRLLIVGLVVFILLKGLVESFCWKEGVGGTVRKFFILGVGIGIGVVLYGLNFIGVLVGLVLASILMLIL